MKKLFIDIDKITEAVKQYETQDKKVSLIGALCVVEPRNGMRKFDDEFGFGKFVVPVNDIITEIEVPEENKTEEDE